MSEVNNHNNIEQNNIVKLKKDNIDKEELFKKSDTLCIVKKEVKNNKKKSKKCFCCGKKRRVILLKCRCEQIFCQSHLLPEKHNCNFNYKEHSKKILEKGNPKVERPKIIEI